MRKKKAFTLGIFLGMAFVEGGFFSQEENFAGKRGFVLSGYVVGEFQAVEKGITPTTFSTKFNPIFLWKFDEMVFVESEVEFAFEGEEAHIGLEYAEVSIFLNPYMVFTIGKMLLPFGIFMERFHPDWINPLPRGPLAWSHDGFAGLSDIGMQIRGAIPIGALSRIGYALFVINGPKLETEGEKAGEVSFAIPQDPNNNKAVGGRIGFLPLGLFEIGASAILGRANTSSVTAFDFDGNGTPDLMVEGNFDVLMLGGDFSAIWTGAWGALRLVGEWAFFSMQNPDTTKTLYAGRKIEKQGAYVRLSYRPDKFSSFLRDVEISLRWEMMDLPDVSAEGNPVSLDSRYLWAGISYWVLPNAVVKVGGRRSLEEKKEEAGGAHDEGELLFFQVSVGF